MGIPSRGRLKKLITKAWCTLRWLERAWERGARNPTVTLSDRCEDFIGKGFSVYYAGVRKCRAERARAAGVRLHVQVLDGHQKWTRRVCCMQRTCKLPSAQLGLFALAGCCDTPSWKSNFCALHKEPPPDVPDGKRIQRLRWKAPLAATLDDMMSFWVGDDQESAQRVPADGLAPGALLAYLREMSLPRAQPATDPQQLRDGEERDDITVEVISTLACTTRKMGRAKRASSNLSRRSKRSGGLLVAVTPEGFVTDAFEFMGSESCAQRYLFLSRLKSLYPELSTVCHDDSCHLRRFANRWADGSTLARQLAYPQMLYILDRFHASGHVDAWSLANVHPAVPENSAALEGVNTSACEILFAWLARYKHGFRKMNRWMGNFFAQEVLDLHNQEFPVAATAARASPSSPSSSSSTASTSSASACASDVSG